MSENNGFIKLYRSTFDNPVVCKDSDHLAVWIYLLCEATHKEVSVMFGGKKIILSAGELTTGRKRISYKLKISESKVERILKLFKSEQQIEQRTDKQCRLISIVNWSEYQCGEQRSEQQTNNDRTTSEQRVNTKQECKKEKNERNIYSDVEPLLVEPLKAFVEHRKKLKKPMTDRAIELFLKKAIELANGNTERCIYLIEHAIEHGWLSVYEPKENTQQQKKTQADIFDEMFRKDKKRGE